MWSTHGKLSRINFDQVWATIELRTYFSIRYFFSTPNNFNQPVTCACRYIWVETRNQKSKTDLEMSFHIHKRISIWNFFNKSFKKKCFDITIRVIKRSRKHKIWTTVIYIYQLKNIFCFFFLSNLSFHLGWNYKPEIKLYQMNS